MKTVNQARRKFLRQCAAAPAITLLVRGDLQAGEPAAPRFLTRGVVLVPEDLTLADWPERAKRAGLSTIALHPFPGRVIQWIRSEAGQGFLDKCRTLGLEVEYELHAMRELLPRNRFQKEPELFRMDAKGERNPDANCCPSNPRTLEAIGRVREGPACRLLACVSRSWDNQGPICIFAASALRAWTWRRGSRIGRRSRTANTGAWWRRRTASWPWTSEGSCC